jgi:hypothetical protein
MNEATTLEIIARFPYFHIHFHVYTIYLSQAELVFGSVCAYTTCSAYALLTPTHSYYFIILGKRKIRPAVCGIASLTKSNMNIT